MKILLAFMLILNFSVLSYAMDASEESQETPIEQLTANTSTNPRDIRSEAEDFDIPQHQQRRYTVEMRNANRAYQDGDITRTEYVGIKRNIIQRMQ